MDKVLTLSFYGPDYRARLTNRGFEVYVSKACATREHARRLAVRWAQARGCAVIEVES